MFTKDGRILWLRDEASLSRRGRTSSLAGVMSTSPRRRKLRRSCVGASRCCGARSRNAASWRSGWRPQQEEERRRIAADIHDDPIQVMSAVDLRLAMLAPARCQDRSELRSMRSSETVGQSIERLRSMVFELRPAALERDGLVAASTEYVAHAGERDWVDVRGGRRVGRRARPRPAGNPVPDGAGGGRERKEARRARPRSVSRCATAGAGVTIGSATTEQGSTPPAASPRRRATWVWSTMVETRRADGRLVSASRASRGRDHGGVLVAGVGAPDAARSPRRSTTMSSGLPIDLLRTGAATARGRQPSGIGATTSNPPRIQLHEIGGRTSGSGSAGSVRRPG